MKLIKEEITEVEFITETVNGKKERFIHGVFMMAETKNKNGRWYPLQVLEQEANRYAKENIEKGRAWGELGHPDTPTINLPLVSHRITELKRDRNNFMGKAMILDTPNGKIVKSLLDGGGNLGVSTRGLGSLKMQNGCNVVQPDFRLATAADIVADPSAPEAFVQGIMEGAEWLLTEHGWKRVDVENAAKQIRNASRYEVEAVALRLFENFMSKLSKV